MSSTSASQSSKASERPSSQTTESSGASERHFSQASARNVRPQNQGGFESKIIFIAFSREYAPTHTTYLQMFIKNPFREGKNL